MVLEENKVKYPAPYLAHWVTGAVSCCKEHCKSLVELGEFMGIVVPVTKNKDKSLECKNCINEAKGE